MRDRLRFLGWGLLCLLVAVAPDAFLIIRSHFHPLDIPLWFHLSYAALPLVALCWHLAAYRWSQHYLRRIPSGTASEAEEARRQVCRSRGLLESVGTAFLLLGLGFSCLGLWRYWHTPFLILSADSGKTVHIAFDPNGRDLFVKAPFETEILKGRTFTRCSFLLEVRFKPSARKDYRDWLSRRPATSWFDLLLGRVRIEPLPDPLPDTLPLTFRVWQMRPNETLDTVHVKFTGFLWEFPRFPRLVRSELEYHPPGTKP